MLFHRFLKYFSTLFFFFFSQGIHFESYDIYSIYQPDAIKHMEVDGVGYIITVNEGHDLDYEAGDREWKDYRRGREFVDGKLKA